MRATEKTSEWQAFLSELTEAEREHLDDAFGVSGEVYVSADRFREWMMRGPGVQALERYRLQTLLARAGCTRAEAVSWINVIERRIA